MNEPETLSPPDLRSCVACGRVKFAAEFPDSSIETSVKSARCSECWDKLMPKTTWPAGV